MGLWACTYDLILDHLYILYQRRPCPLFALELARNLFNCDSQPL